MAEFATYNNYTLEDGRVRLTPLQMSHAQNLLPIALAEPETWEYSLVSAAGKDGLQNYIKLALDARHAGREYPFAVFDKKTNGHAGSTRFYDINLPYLTLQLGYTWYGKNFRGTGLNQHCKFLMLRFAFEEMQMERVEFRADKNNARSIAAMKAIGCKEEGVLRSNMPTRDPHKRRDSIVLSILKNEWFTTVKRNLGKKIELIDALSQ